MTFQQICKDVHMVKTNGQQVFIESRNRPLPRKNTSTGKRLELYLNSECHGRVNSLVFLIVLVFQERKRHKRKFFNNNNNVQKPSERTILIS